MDTGTFLIIAIGVILTYKVVMKILEVVNTAISNKRYTRVYRSKGIDVDFDDVE
jgi:hypothetical protein